MPATKLLIFSDHPASPTGLARITRDLATRIALNMKDEIEVATVGYGSSGSAKLPFQQYSWTFSHNFHLLNLPEVWDDFVGQGSGIMLSIQDLSRLMWLADPDFCEHEGLKRFLKKVRSEKKMKLWGYFPIDAACPNDRLIPQFQHVLKGYDRVLAYSRWAAGLVDRTLNVTGTESLPHGVDTALFYPRDRKRARNDFVFNLREFTAWPSGDVKKRLMRIPPDSLAIGIVATNQPRKDFALGIQAAALIASQRPIFLWIHTDKMKHEWSILELLSDFRLLDRSYVSIGNIPNETMPELYSALDVSLGIGRGEGWGLPIFESIACGTPCIHGNYGGAPEAMPKEYLIEPALYRIEGQWNNIRPVFEPNLWASKALELADTRSKSIDFLEWDNLWPRWADWIRRGIQ